LNIDGWLRGIGLVQYAETFRANDIDGELLGRLTNDDLKDIGVVSFGHRKKLLEAIAALGGAPAAAAASLPVMPAPILAAIAPPLISASIEAAGERRYLCLLYTSRLGHDAGNHRPARAPCHDPGDERRELSPESRAQTQARSG